MAEAPSLSGFRFLFPVPYELGVPDNSSTSLARQLTSCLGMSFSVSGKDFLNMSHSTSLEIRILYYTHVGSIFYIKMLKPSKIKS